MGNISINDMARFESPEYSCRLFYPSGDQVRARKVVRRSNYGHVIKFASTKCARTVELESLLEYDLAILYEFNQDVVVFNEQPFRMEIEANGVTRNLYPDFMVFYDNGSVSVEEVKPSYKLDNLEIVRKFEIQKQVCETLGYEFKVVTENDIRSGVNLNNSKRLLPYRRIVVPPWIFGTLRKWIGRNAITGNELIREVYELTQDQILAMVAQGILITDLSKPLGLESTFQLNTRRPLLTEKQLLTWRRTCS